MRGSRILLIKRDLPPAKGEYFFPGGRIMRGESFVGAARRIAKAEVGLDVINLQQIGTGNLFFKEDPFDHGKGTHTVSFVYKCVIPENQTPKLDSNHKDFIWWDGTSGNYHLYIMNFGAKARFPNVQISKNAMNPMGKPVASRPQAGPN
jgi:colanic acid biosynthesis protein WcaH